MNDATLPEELADLLDGNDLERKIGDTLLLIVGRADDFPRVAMLSVGEIFAPSAREVRLALWRGSKTTESLSAIGKATVVYYAPRTAVYVGLEATRAGESSGLALFTALPVWVRRDEVDYAEITSGVRYVLRDPAAVVPRWRRAIEAMRGM
jgi:hypothetical protein